MEQRMDPRVSAFGTADIPSEFPNGNASNSNNQYMHLCIIMGNQLKAMMQTVQTMNTQFARIESKMDRQFTELKGLISANSSICSTNQAPEATASLSPTNLDAHPYEASNAPPDNSHIEALTQTPANEQSSISDPHIDQSPQSTANEHSPANPMSKKRIRKSVKIDHQKVSEAIQFKRDNPTWATREICRKFNVENAYRIIQNRFRGGVEHDINFRAFQKGAPKLLSETEIQGIQDYIVNQLKEGKDVNRKSIHAHVSNILAQKKPGRRPPSKTFMGHLMMELKANLGNSFPGGIAENQGAVEEEQMGMQEEQMQEDQMDMQEDQMHMHEEQMDMQMSLEDEFHLT